MKRPAEKGPVKEREPEQRETPRGKEEEEEMEDLTGQLERVGNIGGRIGAVLLIP